ncbi:SCO family protein [Pseudorhodobacter turbinis]|uniref:SCO family protein n=1 Tax=Pseudorhodobacter turbinis TaxID=2500533 RepID=A0A4P8EFW0_9RHOB|nr:SCO family protein [Pseudorhodobacter turbinis]QCO55592.1 SCO family protein [Pseudorhodobacter turbinis]
MRLRHIQIGLWIMAGLAALAYGALILRPQMNAQTQEATFRPAFSLPDGAGQLRTTADFAGKFQLVFFGFTNCPDVCLTTLSEVAQVMDDLGDAAEMVQPIFISIDPERDRKLGIDGFTQAFHPAILGLAGDIGGTQAAAESFRIFFEREDAPNAAGGYTMSHSSALYLISPKGDWLRQYDYGTPATEILSDLNTRL